MRLNHSFSVELAERYGIECAILIQHFQFWIEQNQAMGRNYHDGRTWMYQTQKEIAAIYPYWNRDKVQSLLQKLEDEGVLIKDNYNKSPFDKTQWYAFKNEEMFTKVRNRTIDKSERHNPISNTAQPIPDTNPDTNKDIKASSSRASSSSPPKIDDDALKKSFSEEIQVTRTNGQKISMCESDIYRHFVKKPQYTTEMIRRSIEKIRTVSGPVNDILKYLESICEGELRHINTSQESNKIKYEYKQPEPEKPRVKMGDLIKKELEKNKDKK